jgi:hypothetical protein
MLEGYCTSRSYVAGDKIGIHISADTSTFDLSIGREGRARDVVLQRSGIKAQEHPIPSDVVQNGCSWPVTVELEVEASWKSGFYKIELTNSKGDVGETFFILRSSKPTSPILWLIETNTWNAYNSFGGANTYSNDGKSYQGGTTRASFHRPLPKGFLSLPAEGRRMANVGRSDSDDPYPVWAERHGLEVWTGCAGWAQWGSSFAAWLERSGIDVDYACNADLQERPHIVDGYHMLLSVGHDEYWSWEMRDTVESFIATGGNAAFLSGNVSYWQVRLEQEGHQMVAFKTRVAEDPVIGTDRERHNTGIWSHRFTKRPENAMSGLSFTRGGYARLFGAVPASAGGYTIYRPDHWALTGTGLTYGDQLGAENAVVGYECDGCSFDFRDGLPFPTGEDGTPKDLSIIGIAPVALFNRKNAPEELYPEGTLPDLELVCSQMLGSTSERTLQRLTHGHAVLGSYTSPGGGTVFSSGTTEWAFALEDPQIGRITRNVIDRLSVSGRTKSA